MAAKKWIKSQPSIELISMTDKVFIDTNILVYAFLDADCLESHIKHTKAVELLQSLIRTCQIILSTQVLSEYYSALLKHKITDNDIQNSIQALIRAVAVSSVSVDTVLASFHIKNRYKFSYWDSLIIASALENNCAHLYSEDLQNSQNSQIIKNTLYIKNPFQPDK